MPSEGNPALILRLDRPIRSGLQVRAMSRGVSLNELAKFVLIECPTSDHLALGVRTQMSLNELLHQLMTAKPNHSESIHADR